MALVNLRKKSYSKATDQLKIYKTVNGPFPFWNGMALVSRKISSRHACLRHISQIFHIQWLLTKSDSLHFSNMKLDSIVREKKNSINAL